MWFINTAYAIWTHDLVSGFYKNPGIIWIYKKTLYETDFNSDGTKFHHFWFKLTLTEWQTEVNSG